LTIHKVTGKDRESISSADVLSFVKSYSSCTLDIGAGDGKGSLRFARSHPDIAVLALDSSFDALEHTSKSARKKPARGGAQNLLCLYGNIKDSSELAGIAQHIRVYLPWGDLLEGIAEMSTDIVGAIALCGSKGTRVDLVINAEIWKENLPHRLSHLGEITPEFFSDNKDEFEKQGIHIEEAHWMSDDDISALDTTWSAKLMSSRDTARFVTATGVVTENVPDHRE
jgi:16S rRNA (adenine(1408)-N(1))-methyltransferase